ncbi:MAG: glycosyltransferase family 4 protein [Bryobacterales bacterium]|nr:glycosyltransferase family 4 protein [Bryobacterales bacterium]
MRISVDAHAVGRKLTGNEVYIRSLLNEAAAMDSGHELIAYVSEPGASKQLDNRIQCWQVSRNPFKRLGWDLRRCLLRDRPDLLHIQYTGPLFSPVPIVVSVHDVSFVERPEFFPAARVAQLQRTVPRTIRQAVAILTPSEFSARAIQRVYGTAPEKIHVVHNGVSASFRPVSREVARAEVERRYGVPGPYLLTVGDLQPRKNQVGLIAAFEDLMRERPELPHHLVMAGKGNWHAGEVMQRARRSALSGRIHFTGFVPDEALLHLYGGCDLFVFPSFYEGFGIPIVEAMACGRAVACSNTSATAEVADGAALLFSPDETREMAAAIRDVLLDPELRLRMERLGQQRAAMFRWRPAAERTMEIYAGVAEAARTNSSKTRRASAHAVPVSRS